MIGQVSNRSPLVGRDRELEALVSAWRDAASGGATTAVITGEPGIGKTRLTQELAAIVEGDGGVVLRGRTSRDSVISYEPIVEALNEHVRSIDVEAAREVAGGVVGDLGRIVPLLRDGGDTPSGDREADREALFDAVATFISNVAKTAPVLLIADDVQWAEVGTRRLITYLVERGLSCVMLVLTHRSGDVIEKNAVGALMAELTQAGGAPRRVDLAGLDDNSVEELADGLLDRWRAQLSLGNLVARTGGNPFFVEELLSRAGAAGGTPLPEGIAALLQNNLSRVSTDGLRAAQCLAVRDRNDVPLALLAAALGWSHEQTGDAVDDAVAVGVLRRGATTADFSHALYRETVAGDLSATRRARLERAWAIALQADEGVEPGDVARHLMAAGALASVADVVTWAQRAAAVALERVDYAEAAALNERAYDNVTARGGVDDSVEMDLLTEAASAARADEQNDTAAKLAELAVARAAASGDPVLIGRAALVLADALVIWGSPNDRVLEVVDDALAFGESLPPPTRSQLLAIAGIQRAYNGDRAAGPLIDAGIALCRDNGQLFLVGGAVLARHFASPGPLEAKDLPALAEAVEFVSSDIAVGSGVRMRGGGTWSYGVLLDAYLILGEVERYEATLEQLRMVVAERPTPYREWVVANLDAARARRARPLAEAAPMSMHALTVGSRNAQGGAMINFSVRMLITRVEQDRAAEIEPLLASTLTSSEYAAFVPVHAWVLALCNRPEEGRAALASALADNGARVRRDSFFAAGLAAAAEAAIALDDTRIAHTVYDLLRPYGGQSVVIPGVSLVVGAADRYLGALAAHLGDDAEAARRFEAALAVNDRVGCAYQLGWTQADYADLLDRTGDAARAADLRAGAATIASDYGLVRLARRLGA